MSEIGPTNYALTSVEQLRARIERYEAALRRIADARRYDARSWEQFAYDIRAIARAALEDAPINADPPAGTPL